MHPKNSRHNVPQSSENRVALLQATLAKLRSSRETLRSYGIRHAAIFGSLARGEATLDSDIDILVELDPEAHIGLFEFVGIQLQLAELLGHDVDVVSRNGLRPGRHDSILIDAIEAF